jgi:hypothetical protein
MSDRKKMIEAAGVEQRNAEFIRLRGSIDAVQLDCVFQGFKMGALWADQNPAPSNPGAGDYDAADKYVAGMPSPRYSIREAFAAGSRFKESQMRERIAELEARKCSHGDYRMQWTTDCSKYSCGGRTELYIIGEGLCIECRHKAERKPEESVVECRGCGRAEWKQDDSCSNCGVQK